MTEKLFCESSLVTVTEGLVPTTTSLPCQGKAGHFGPHRHAAYEAGGETVRTWRNRRDRTLPGRLRALARNLGRRLVSWSYGPSWP